MREMVMLFTHIVNSTKVWSPRYRSPFGGDCLQKRTEITGINLTARFIHEMGDEEFTFAAFITNLSSRHFIEIAGKDWAATISISAGVPGFDCRSFKLSLPMVRTQHDFYAPCGESVRLDRFLSNPKLRGIHAFKKDMTILKLFSGEWETEV